MITMRLTHIKLIPVAIISLVILLIGLTPVSGQLPPYCSVEDTDDGLTYQLVANPCSEDGVPPGWVTATATSTNPGIVQVIFFWFEPNVVPDPYPPDTNYKWRTKTTGGAFEDTQELLIAGDWIIIAAFHEVIEDPPGEPKHSLSSLIYIRILVVNEYAIGTVAATLAALTGLVAYTRFRRPKAPIIR
jgi:hypothetical protein